MEEMLGQKMRPPICFRQFLENYRKKLQDAFIPNVSLNIKEILNVNEDRINVLQQNCSLHHLKQVDDARITKFMPGFTEIHRKNISHIPHAALNLKTFNKLLKAKETTIRNPFKRSRESFKMVQLPNSHPDKRTEFYNDLLITVRIYRPARATHIGQSLEKPVFAEEFECLGSHYLTELRDKINCVCNDKKFFDISEKPMEELPKKYSDPGYFFITDTFYNDRRNENNVDYSETIRMWAKRAPGLEKLAFKVAKMEETTFTDLTVSLGFPQLYQHHGNCEHVFTFSQVELFSPAAECYEREQYPRLRSFGVYNNRLCNMCGILHYNYIVEQSDRQLHDPSYLCSKCFLSFHYTDGKKIGTFKAYRINHLDEEDVSSSLDKMSEGSNTNSSDGAQAEAVTIKEEILD